MSKIVHVVLGAAAGFVAGILLAPKSGKETREDIKQKALEAKDYATEAAGVVKNKATAGYAVVKDGATEAGKEVTSFSIAPVSVPELLLVTLRKQPERLLNAKDTGRGVRDVANK